MWESEEKGVFAGVRPQDDELGTSSTCNTNMHYRQVYHSF